MNKTDTMALQANPVSSCKQGSCMKSPEDDIKLRFGDFNPIEYTKCHNRQLLPALNRSHIKYT